jgi:hypothetical protein
VVGALEVLDLGQRAHQGDTAAGDDAFLDRRTGGVQGVFDAGLLLLHLDFGGGTDLDHGHTAGELGQTLLELLAVVVGGGVLDLGADLLARALDVVVLAGAVDDGGVFLADLDRLAEPSSFRVAFSRVRPTSSEMTVPPVRMAMSCSMALRRSPKPGALTAQTLTMPRMVLTTSVASASPSMSSATISSGAGLGDGFQHRQQLADVGDLLVVQQDEGVFQLGRSGSAGC